MAILLKIITLLITHLLLPLAEKLIRKQINNVSESADIEKTKAEGEKRLRAIEEAKRALDEIAYNNAIDDI